MVASLALGQSQGYSCASDLTQKNMDEIGNHQTTSNPTKREVRAYFFDVLYMQISMRNWIQ